jgi:XTP/dITP diphosphohydrolase
MKKIVLASSNQGKLKEMSAVLTSFSFELLPQSHFSIQTPEETGVTFIENALLKARHACKKTGLAAIADDSGLVVPALDGEPGIFSSRYAGANASDEENIAYLLKRIGNATSRHAYFYSVIVYLKHESDPTPLIAEGRWDGEIALKKRGHLGFGYDPIFYLPSLKLTAAQLATSEKNQRSHRAQALQALIEKIKTHE